MALKPVFGYARGGRNGGAMSGMGAGENREQPRRLLVIHNPLAGRRAAKTLARWLAALDALGAAVTLETTAAPLHARAIAGGADPQRFDAVAVAGGDGTINEAVNGLVGSALPLAVLPLGTANLLANELGLPRDLEALARIAAFAPARRVRPGEIASGERAEPWRFLLMAGAGFDAEVVAHLDLRLKRRIGRGAYLWGSLAQLMRHSGARLEAALDQRRLGCGSLVVARAHFYGGRFVLAPEARLDADRLYAVVFEGSSPLATARYLVAAVAQRLAQQRDVRVIAAEQIELSGPPGTPVQIDGDIRAHLPARIRLADAAVGLIS
ncbi:MAG: diacylglycerol/lipid kinase family protein [Stellaceae bacterium]